MRQLHIFKTFIYEPEKRHLVDYNALQMYMFADRLQHYREIIEPALQMSSIRWDLRCLCGTACLLYQPELITLAALPYRLLARL
ncbi:hypothetical protein A3844_10155 [Paenibacillus helianthi]|uniref:Uncharacterized protein n=1 Tax=Paenibacillus helianthi TaxID=1349432 RepID=A0ABX3ESL2_9BACL|nr:hypothetical protein [Paenibacillus sp. P32E]OKP87759.1 hypothetical protein A3844_10155 [Paenibacillus helianthi]OKP93423.1 hypothetical protein A3848_05485 [Paenibacillus sp. P32E]